MLTFYDKKGRLNIRSAAVIIQQDHCLLHRAIDDDFWALPGGRVEFFEHSDQTLSRELLEELNWACRIERPLWYVESFFEYRDIRYHEIANYFLVELENTVNIESEIDFDGIEKDVDLIFRWVPISKLKSYCIKPDFLKEKLLNLPEQVEFIKIDEL